MTIFPEYIISAGYYTKPRLRKQDQLNRTRDRVRERGCVASLAVMRRSLAACRVRNSSALVPVVAFNGRKCGFQHCRGLATSSNYISTTIDDATAPAAATESLAALPTHHPVKRALVVGGGVAGRRVWDCVEAGSGRNGLAQA